MDVIPLLSDLRDIILGYLPNLTLLEAQANEELQRRFLKELQDIFGNSKDVLNNFLNCLKNSGAIISGSLLVHFLLDEPHTFARDIDIFVNHSGSQVQVTVKLHIFTIIAG